MDKPATKGHRGRWKSIGAALGAVLVGSAVYLGVHRPVGLEPAAAVPVTSGEVPSARTTETGATEQEGTAAEPSDVLEVLVFSSSNCAECQIVREQVIPQLRVTFGSAIRVRTYDLADDSSYSVLVEQEKRVGSQEPVTAKLFVGKRYLAGVEQIGKRAVEVVKEALAERLHEGA